MKRSHSPATSVCILIFAVAAVATLETQRIRFRPRPPRPNVANSLIPLGPAAQILFDAAQRTLDAAPATGRPRAYLTQHEGKLVSIVDDSVPDSTRVQDFFIDEKLLQSGELDRYRFEEGERFLVLGGRGDSWPVLADEAIDGVMHVEVSPSLLVRADRTTNLDVVREIHKWDFSGADINVIGLFSEIADRTTVDRINGLRDKTHRVAIVDTREQLLEEIQQSPGRLVIVVGHVEDDAFIVSGARGEVLGRPIAFSELERVQKESGAAVFFLGCETGRFLGRGPITKVNSVELLQQLDRALGSSNYLDFFSRIGTADAPVVIDQVLAQQAHNDSGHAE